MRYDLLKRHAQLNRVVRIASRFLGEPGRLALLDYGTSAVFEREAIYEASRGVLAKTPVESFHQAAHGHDISLGIERFRVNVEGRTLRAVKLTDPFEAFYPMCYEVPWVLPRADYVRLYRFIRRKVRTRVRRHDVVPIMTAVDRARLFDNSVGFLQGDAALYARYEVPRKRGVLLLGEPGNGKTMACRWLMRLCQDHGLHWRTITVEQFDEARQNGLCETLFRLPEPGVILFDDFDLGMRKRDEFGPTRDHSAMLSGLDGVKQTEGAVYLFTTNVALTDLDPAFLRRGRIDQIIHFRRPAAELRREYLERFWHADLKVALNLDAIVAQTDGCSYAEMSELKKLLVLGFMETQNWDWEAAWSAFLLSRDTSSLTKQIGFVTHAGAERLPAEPSVAISARGGRRE